MNNSGKVLELIRVNKPLIVSRFGVQDIAMFGSYAKDNSTENSDVDIFVTFKKGSLTYDNFMDLKFYLEELLCAKIDLVVKNSIRKEFQESIFNDAVYA